jgi:ergothioneine biosynthesis protein EgtB
MSRTNCPVLETSGESAIGAGMAHVDLGARYREIRAATEKLCEPLSPEDCTVQSMPEASPAKWHLAHTSWFFETFVLEREVADYRPFRSPFQVLFNSYYNTVGYQHPRPRRGLLTRPSLTEVVAYRRRVDDHMQALLERPEAVPPPLAALVELGLNHEQQHQELILTDIKHLLAANPLHPAYRECRLPDRRDAATPHWCPYPQEGIHWIGHDGQGFAFDNEGPRHKVFLRPFELTSRPVTNGEFLEFMADGGYQRPDLWLSDGWATLRSQGWRAPLYWEQKGEAWCSMTLCGLRELRSEEPVCHVSYYEADAYARWVGARLPSEVEWESAAVGAPLEGSFVEDGFLHPRVSDSPSLDTDHPRQLLGDVWEWTQSSYGPYPGYWPPPGALGEYNGKFMSGQMVLRGGSCATPRTHIRPTYRNFFYPRDRWQFSGIRLARDL